MLFKMPVYVCFCAVIMQKLREKKDILGNSSSRMTQQLYAVIRVCFLILDAYCILLYCQRYKCTGCSFYCFDMLTSLGTDFDPR